MFRHAISAVESLVGSGRVNPIPSLPSAPTVGRRTAIIRDTLLIAITDLKIISGTRQEPVEEQGWDYHPSVGPYLRDMQCPAEFTPRAIRLDP